MSRSRRDFIKGSGAGLLTFYIAGCAEEMTPQQARDAGIEYGVLTESEVAVLDALGDILLPGSSEAGLSHYIDHQLGASESEQMLMLKYLGVPAPYVDFYRSSLASLESIAVARHRIGFAALTTDDQAALVGEIAQTVPDGWSGPPAPFFSFVTRADAVDVFYGTQEGFERLNVPYMAHILPPSPWGAA